MKIAAEVKIDNVRRCGGCGGVLKANGEYMHQLSCPEARRQDQARVVGSEAWMDQVFSYHAPVFDQADRYASLRQAARVFAEAICRQCPQSADRTAALRKVREALMTANAAVALDGLA